VISPEPSDSRPAAGARDDGELPNEGKGRPRRSPSTDTSISWKYQPEFPKPSNAGDEQPSVGRRTADTDRPPANGERAHHDDKCFRGRRSGRDGRNDTVPSFAEQRQHPPMEPRDTKSPQRVRVVRRAATLRFWAAFEPPEPSVSCRSCSKGRPATMPYPRRGQTKRREWTEARIEAQIRRKHHPAPWRIRINGRSHGDDASRFFGLSRMRLGCARSARRCEAGRRIQFSPFSRFHHKLARQNDRRFFASATKQIELVNRARRAYSQKGTAIAAVSISGGPKCKRFLGPVPTPRTTRRRTRPPGAQQ